jgi:hypothetical protein
MYIKRMKKVFVLAACVCGLAACAGGKAAGEQAKADGVECDALFARIKDYKDNPELLQDFETRYELSKQSFPLSLGNGDTVYCREAITCNGTNYCVIMTVDGKWSYVL